MPDYLTTEDIKRKRFQALPRNKRRSVSLDNLSKYEVTPEPSPQLDSKLKGLKKKLNIKLSKSNTDLTHSAVNSDGNRFLPVSNSGGNLLDVRASPRDTRKHLSKEYWRRKEHHNVFDSRGDIFDSSSSVKLTVNDKPEMLVSPTMSSSIDSSDVFMTYDSGEYLDDTGSTYETDETDATAGSLMQTAQKIEKLLKKIEKTRDELVNLQAIRDENVSDYLNATDNSADAASNEKVKLNFERNNQKTKISIQLLQKKLLKYQSQVKELEGNEIHGTKRIMKVVQDSVRSGASSITGAVAKPLESFNNFMKKEKKTSSCENLATTDNDDDPERAYFNIQTSDEENYSSSGTNLIKLGVLDNLRRRINTSNNESTWSVDDMKEQVEKLERENVEMKDSNEQLKEQMNRVMQTLQDERYRTEQLRNRLDDLTNQSNDLTELHQNQMMSMREEMDRTVERIDCVEYRFTERAAELEENVENFVTRISKMEKLQQEKEQPLDTLVDMDPKILLSKFISLLINICTVIAFIIISIINLLKPFLSNQTRVVSTVFAIITIVVLWKNSDNALFRYIADLLPFSNGNSVAVSGDR